MNNWKSRRDAWKRFLKWLNLDSEKAGYAYEAVRRRLIIFFNCRGCANSEDLADKTIDRIIGKISEIADSYQGDPAKYFFGVAHFVHLEDLRDRQRMNGEPVSEDFPDSNHQEEAMEKELISHCLHRCLQKLPPDKRELFLAYYQTAEDKAGHHQALADERGCTLNALRLQMMRLRAELRACITACQQRGFST
ncbi:MAG TPA: hypothetical protein PLD20_00310 [Blastocatellia bacterium]|nr:hypothetical protein [Blastocatellia bacterium]HMX25043.1 hypothetical protein [Blastocatellia bacterium]HMZ16376.1 hypothetical protein [Blastocatellia bacterium]HNG28825.1 hypothetical protein [Blastocatellia bacterium]